MVIDLRLKVKKIIRVIRVKDKNAAAAGNVYGSHAAALITLVTLDFS